MMVVDKLLTSLSEFKAVRKVRFMNHWKHFGVFGLIGRFHGQFNRVVD